MPTVAETVDDVGGVTHNFEQPRMRLHRFEGRHDLHPLIRRVGLAAAGESAIDNRPGPSAGTRVTAARTIGVHDCCHAFSVAQVRAKTRHPPFTQNQRSYLPVTR